MSNKINTLSAAYAKLLNAIGITEQSNGLLVQKLPKSPEKEVLVNELPLILPKQDNVRNPDPSTVIFHPLSENLLLGESPVIQELRGLMMDYLHDLILSTVECMLQIAIDPNAVKELSPTQIEHLKCTADLDEKTLENWKAIMRKTDSRRSTNRVLTLYLKRGGQLNGKDYKRAAIVNFNLYQELVSGKFNVYDVKLRKKDCTIFAKVLETIIDDIAIQDKYSVGSDSLVAPYFDVLVRAYAGILKTINGPLWNFRKPIEQLKGSSLHTKDDFSEHFTDLLQYRDIIPPLPFNDGDRNEKRDGKLVQEQPAVNGTPIPEQQLPGISTLNHTNHAYYAPQMATTPVTVQTEPQVPVQPQQPVQHVSEQLGSIADQVYGQPQQPMTIWQQEVMYGAYPQQAMFNQPTFWQQQYPQQPIVEQATASIWNNPVYNRGY